MATAAIASVPITLRMKLLVDTRGQRVLFAEASKDVVDFLFSLLALPVGAVAMLLGQDSVVGSVGGLYRSVENLDRSYAQPGTDLDALLRPPVPPPAAGYVSSLLGLPDTSARPRCPSCGGRRTQLGTTSTVHVGGNLYCPVISGANSAAKSLAGGFVQGYMTYTVMDDLAMAPMSTISSISVFNTMAVRDLGAVQERTVQIGYTEVRKIQRSAPVLRIRRDMHA
jgi:hypothetical protein